MRFKKLKVARMLGGALGLLLALSLVLVPAPALAVPPLPHQFYGTVTIDTELAPEGTIVSAQIGGVEYLSTTVDAEGRYGYAPLFKVPADDLDTPEVKEGGVAGETVEFYIGLGEAPANETALFEVWGVTELDLTVTTGVDTTPPTVVSTLPLANATGVAIDVVVSATFSEDIQAGANFGGIAISEATGVSASIDGATLTIAHDAFAYETSYTVTIPAGAVKDSADNPLAVAKVWSFTVVTEEEAEFDPYIYDTNEDGEFSKAETLAAVNAYLAGTITKNSVLEVIKLYFS